MPSTLHEHLVTAVRDAIAHQLGNLITADTPTGQLARRVDSLGSTWIDLRDGSRHEADASWGPLDPVELRPPEFPSLIMEVAYAQRKKDLGRLARQYAQWSNGTISTLIGFDLGYSRDRRSRIFVWEVAEVGTDENGPHLTLQQVSCEVSSSLLLVDV